MAELARALAILKRAAAAVAVEVVPLLRMACADPADVAALIDERLVAVRADQRRRAERRRRRVAAMVRAAHGGTARERTGTLQQHARTLELLGDPLAHLPRALADLRRRAQQPPHLEQQRLG